MAANGNKPNCWDSNRAAKNYIVCWKLILGVKKSGWYGWHNLKEMKIKREGRGERVRKRKWGLYWIGIFQNLSKLKRSQNSTISKILLAKLLYDYVYPSVRASIDNAVLYIRFYLCWYHQFNIVAEKSLWLSSIV